MRSTEILSGLPDDTRVLDFFAGDATIISGNLSRFSDLTLWEIRPECMKPLHAKMPHAKIQIGDSYQMAQLPRNQGRFDLVFMDNHAGEFSGHIEHFDALQLVPRLLSESGGYLIFNVVTDPYLYHLWHFIRNSRVFTTNVKSYHKRIVNGSFSRWLKGRVDFYGKVSLNRNEVLEAYGKAFNAYNLHISEPVWVRRRPFLYMLRLRLKQ